MRQLSAVLGLGVICIAIAGCNSTRWSFLKAPEVNTPAAKPGDAKVQSLASLVDYLNDNAGRINTLQASSLDVTATEGVQRINLRGKMVAEKPRGFRMSLDGPLGFAQVADLGSNRDEFWFWIKGPMGQAANPQYYCSYKDFERGAAVLPIPFQPEWIMETLGLGPYGPVERYKLDYDEQTLHLTERMRSPQGPMVRKVIVMKRKKMEAPEPQITHFLLIDDATNREICSAHITQTMVDPATGAILPRRLDLNWPEKKSSLSIIMDKVQVNVPLAPQAFVRQPLTGVQSYNLARGAGDPAGVQRVQGFMPK
jgi:hypothetical protein